MPKLLIFSRITVHILVTHTGALSLSSGTSYFPLTPQMQGGGEWRGVGEDLLALSLPSCQSISSNPFQIITEKCVCADQQLLISLYENLLGLSLESLY